MAHDHARALLKNWRGLSRGRTLASFPKRRLEEGARVELEHAGGYLPLARRIAADHLVEDKDYYRKLAALGISAGSTSLYAFALTRPKAVIGPSLDSPRAGPRASWRYPTPVPLTMLSAIPARASIHLARRMTGAERLDSLRRLRVLPPIEVAVAPDGKVRLLDGNHRLIVARERGDESIDVAFLVVDKSDDRFVPASLVASRPRSS